MSLRYPFKYLHEPTEEEQRQNASFLLLEEQADKLCEDADLLAKLGKPEKTVSKYKSILYGQMIIIYISNIRSYMEREGLYPTSCNIYDVDEKFKVDCIIEGLSCKSRGGINLRQLFDDVLEIYQLSIIPCTVQGEFKNDEFNKPEFVD